MNLQIRLTEFSDLIASYTADFIGREWLVEQVDALLTDPDCRFVVLTGGPGVGKTAFLAHLAATHPQWPRYFIRRDSRDLLRPGDANTFLLTIGGQLATLSPHLFYPENLEVIIHQRIGSVEAGGEATGVRIEELRASPFYHVALLAKQEIRRVKGKATTVQIGRLVSEPRLLQIQDLQYLGLLDPARLLAQEDPEARIVVLVDALDELRYSPAEPDILRALRELPEVPPNLRFVVSSRPESFLDRLLARSDAYGLALDVGGADNQTDLRTYTEDVIADDGLAPVLTEEGLSQEVFVEGLLGKAAGNFLYLKSVLLGIQEALGDPDKRDRLSYLLRVEELPDDLGALYGYFLASIVDWAERKGFGKAAWRQYLRPLLGVLAVAREPLNEEQLLTFTALKQEDLRDLLHELCQFIESVDDDRPVYRIYHTSFAEYLIDSRRKPAHWIDPKRFHRQLTDLFLSIYRDNWVTCKDVYCLHNLAEHLFGANSIQDLCLLIENPGWYTAHLEHDRSLRGYVGDLDLAFAAVAHQDSRCWPHLVANSLIRATLTEIARHLPAEAYEALVRLGKGGEALERARLVPEVSKKEQIFERIWRTAQEIGEQSIIKQVREELASLLVSQESHPASDEPDWLINLVSRLGAEEALRQLLRVQVTLGPDWSATMAQYIQVARVAFDAGQSEEAHKLLLECLGLVDRTWDWDRRRFLIQIAHLLLRTGHEGDILDVIELALEIEIEQERIYTLAELALVCSDASDVALIEHALKAAVAQVESAAPRSNRQHELSKIALAMSKAGDDRANKFFEDAIRQAEERTQPAWYWQEQDAWVKMAEALASSGLCDEALDLAKRLDLGRPGAKGVVVELALRDRWNDAWGLAQDLPPLVRKHALLSTAYALAKRRKLDHNQYRSITTQIEGGIEQSKHPNEQAETLEQLTGLARLVRDEAGASEYLLQFVGELDNMSGQVLARLIVRACRHAVKLSDAQALRRLVSRTETLPEDSYYSRSTTMAALCRAWADRGDIDHAWVLAQSIADDGMRLEAYVRICESAYGQEKVIDKYFDEALNFARRIDNVGWVPTFWGALALLAHQLGHNATQECIDKADQGARDLASHITFRAYNSASVAEYLHRIGMPRQPLELLKHGLTCVEPVDVSAGIDAFQRLTKAMVRTKMTALWPRVLQIAQAVGDPVQRANALLGVTHAIAYLGDRDRAIGNLPHVLAAIHCADRSEVAIIEFGAMLGELLQSDSEVLDSLIRSVFEHARVENRSTVLTWTASLLPVFAKVDSSLASAIWHRIKQVEAIFEQ